MYESSPLWVEQPRDGVLDIEQFLGDLHRHEIGVVKVGHRGHAVSPFDACAHQRVLVGDVARECLAVEPACRCGRTRPAHGREMTHVVVLSGQLLGQLGPHAAAAADDDVHVVCRLSGRTAPGRSMPLTDNYRRRTTRYSGMVTTLPTTSSAPTTALSVLLAAPRGFCAGVERAIEIVELALRVYGAPVYVRHAIVHNNHVVADLEAKGAVFVEETDEVPPGGIVVFSAHGVGPQVKDAAVRQGLETIDATCPLVTKVHYEARDYAEMGYSIVLIGHEGHQEVVGTMGHAPDNITLVETPEDVDALEVPDPDRVAYVSQTTLSVDEANRIIAALKRKFPNARGPRGDDICYATQNRQDATRALADRSDLVLVVGSPTSSNSMRMVEVALEQGTPASYLIDDASEIDPVWFDGVSTVGGHIGGKRARRSCRSGARGAARPPRWGKRRTARSRGRADAFRAAGSAAPSAVGLSAPVHDLVAGFGVHLVRIVARGHIRDLARLFNVERRHAAGGVGDVLQPHLVSIHGDLGVVIDLVGVCLNALRERLGGFLALEVEGPLDAVRRS